MLFRSVSQSRYNLRDTKQRTQKLRNIQKKLLKSITDNLDLNSHTHKNHEKAGFYSIKDQGYQVHIYDYANGITKYTIHLAINDSLTKAYLWNNREHLKTYDLADPTFNQHIIQDANNLILIDTARQTNPKE